jgi:hypothetical protein
MVKSISSSHWRPAIPNLKASAEPYCTSFSSRDVVVAGE